MVCLHLSCVVPSCSPWCVYICHVLYLHVHHGVFTFVVMCCVLIVHHGVFTFVMCCTFMFTMVCLHLSCVVPPCSPWCVYICRYVLCLNCSPWCVYICHVLYLHVHHGVFTFVVMCCTFMFTMVCLHLSCVVPSLFTMVCLHLSCVVPSCSPWCVYICRYVLCLNCSPWCVYICHVLYLHVHHGVFTFVVMCCVLIVHHGVFTFVMCCTFMFTMVCLHLSCVVPSCSPWCVYICRYVLCLNCSPWCVYICHVLYLHVHHGVFTFVMCCTFMFTMVCLHLSCVVPSCSPWCVYICRYVLCLNCSPWCVYICHVLYLHCSP